MAPPDENSAKSGGMHTHYDNLKVARNAPIEVIRAAYRALSAKYHPDLNPGSDQAVRAMKIINAAYEVLSDPERRHQHDQWIASIESDPIESPPSTQAHEPPKPPAQSRKPSRPASARSKWEIRKNHATRTNTVILVAVFVLALVIGTAVGIFMSSTTPATSSISGRKSIPTGVVVAPPASEPPAVRPRYTRPSLAPNGLPWPLTSGYLTPYRAVNTDDLSSITIDNRQNSSDVLVKLFDRSSDRAVAVRVFFLRAQEQFTLANVAAGAYDIRYQNLDSGMISKSQPFNLEEVQQSDGTWQYTVMTLTLYVVSNGNTRFEGIGPDDF